ncbi:MAG: hypothetical protein FWD17_15200 [Polyangiaceae bacterium]|nr:hypothetical protein [Polyangiaceae bacterium]
MYDRMQLLHTLYSLSLHAAADRLALTPNEARCILDACNGLYLHEGLLGQHLRHEVQDAVRLNHLDDKWQVNGRSLIERLRELPRPLTAAVELWIADFWASEKLNDVGWEKEHLALLVKEEAP